MKDKKKKQEKNAVEGIRKHAKRMSYSWGILAIVLFIFGFLREKQYIYLAIAILILNFYWVWRGWFWMKQVK
ncbi:hypothetical protein B6U91_01670 [Candidatus Pacearchaeota archaeon ex4484_71]|nr:MAG: hypothetical protein B6U91_01670 [Candidatus Pacearchaeota archaeon ex4484_71]